MSPQQFIAKWQRANLIERSAAQQHFLDLCEVLNQPKPAAADRKAPGTPSSTASTRPAEARAGPTSGCRATFGWEYNRRLR
jgi:hypothetical protein